MSGPAHVYDHFYRVPRMGAIGLSDGGGPFGFDITIALQVDYAIRAFACDAIVETGCYLGDTTEYLAATYPSTPVITCDGDARSAGFTRRRVAQYPNATVHTEDSPLVVRSALASPAERPFFYLDAHGGDPWPLHDELAAIDRGIVCIHDFDIGDRRFGFDSYDGVACGPGVLQPFRSRIPVHFVSNPDADYPYPCLQVGRRTACCFCAVGLDREPFEHSAYFSPRITPDAVV